MFKDLGPLAIHLAITHNDGKSNVVQVGGIRAMNESELLIADVLFDKIKKEHVRKKQGCGRSTGKMCAYGYQLKGQAMIFTDGKIIEGVKESMIY